MGKRSRFLDGLTFKSKFLPKNVKPENVKAVRSHVRAKSYVPFHTRRSVQDDVLYTPFRPVHHSAYDSSGNDNYTRSQVNRELMMSTAAMEDSYDLSSRSRNRDRDVLALANRAISPPPSTTTKRRAYSEGGRHSLRRPYGPSSTQTAPYTTTTTILPLDLTDTAAPPTSMYAKYANTMNNVKSLRDGTYQPMYSKTVRVGESPLRDFSPSRSRSLFRDESPYRFSSPYRSLSRSRSPTPGSNYRSVKKRIKPRVLSTKRRVGNYYNRLLTKRGADSTQGKYWPYIDVEDIATENVNDLYSDTESVAPEPGTTYIIRSGGAGSYNDEETPSEYSYTPATYAYSPSYNEYEAEDDIPDEYVPFRPRVRHVSPERDYSDLSVTPFLPRFDPTKNTSADAISFNSIVAASAIRARQALERINFKDYDSAGLVLSVEGEYRSPENEIPVGFRYISRPIPLKTPIANRVSVHDSDNVFTKYVTDLQRFREGVRSRLDEGYRALTETTKSYTPSLTSSYTTPYKPILSSAYQSYTPSSSTRALSYDTTTSYEPHQSTPSPKSYHRRLRDDSQYKYGHSIELYPISTSRASSVARALPSSSDALPSSRAITLYDSKSDTDSKMSTLDKIQIKEDTEVHASPRVAVAVRRTMRGHSMPPAGTTHVVRRTEAALLGNKVDVVLPERRQRRPKSAYVQNKMREIRRDNRDISPAAVVAEHTTELRAHRPVQKPCLVKPIRDVDGVKKSNIMSWQPKEPSKSDKVKRKRQRLMRKHQMEY